jgi:dipeptide/tripeptide permease
MNDDAKQGAVLILGILLAWIFYKTGISYTWQPIDQLALVMVIIGIPFFFWMWRKRQ